MKIIKLLIKFFNLSSDFIYDGRPFDKQIKRQLNIYISCLFVYKFL